MKAYWIKSPRWLSFIFKKRIWSYSSKEKVLYLTFDDGPTGVTSFVLEQLALYNAKATFFCIGDNIDRHPQLFKDIKRKGHSIGNHTQHHSNGWKTSTEDYFSEVMLTNSKVLADDLKTTTKLFRPPFGKCTRAQRKLIYKQGYQIIMWSVLSADFDSSVSKVACLNNVLDNATNGNIIVFHDSKKCEEKIRFVLPKVLEYFSKQGFVFKRIDSSTK